MNISRLSTLLLSLAIAVFALGYVNPSSAGKPGRDCEPPSNHPSCKDEDSGTDGATFSVVIYGGGLMGESAEDWLQSFGGKNTIGLNHASAEVSDVGTLTGVSSLTGLNPSCFPSDFMGPHGKPFQLHQASINRKKGKAQAGFFFHGLTFEGNVRVLYDFLLIGEFESGEWPPTDTAAPPTVLKMTSWELSVEKEGQAITSISCKGEGPTPTPVTITVTKES